MAGLYKMSPENFEVGFRRSTPREITELLFRKSKNY